MKDVIPNEISWLRAKEKWGDVNRERGASIGGGLSTRELGNKGVGRSRNERMQQGDTAEMESMLSTGGVGGKETHLSQEGTN